jgi:hypothetical protein
VRAKRHTVNFGYVPVGTTEERQPLPSTLRRPRCSTRYRSGELRRVEGDGLGPLEQLALALVEGLQQALHGRVRNLPGWLAR